MDAMTQIAATLGSISKTPQEKRREKNQRYYQRNSEGLRFYRVYVNRLRTLAKLFQPEAT